MKKMLLILTAGLYSITNSTIDSIDTTVGEKSIKASVGTNWQFELKNKTPKPIYVQLVAGKSDNLSDIREDQQVIPDKFMRINTSILPTTPKKELDEYAGYLRLSNLNPRREWHLLIWSLEDARKSPSQMSRAESPTYLYRIKLNRNRKRVFLTWADNELHSPGTTRFSTSASGISLQDNVSNSDLVKEKRNSQFKYIG